MHGARQTVDLTEALDHHNPVARAGQQRRQRLPHRAVADDCHVYADSWWVESRVAGHERHHKSKLMKIVNCDLLLQSSPSRTVTTAPDAQPRSTRGQRRRAETRARLVDAARTLFARQGVDNTRINEITDQADVGFGSFYNHFESKEAIVEAVFAEMVATQGAAIEAVTTDLEDPAEVVAAAHRYFVDLARTNPDWAWLLIRLDISHQVTLAALGPFARRDLDRGIRSGRFKVANRRVALLACGGALLAVMRAVADGNAPRDAGGHHAEGILRLLGLTPEDAAEVARRPFPQV